MKIIDSKYLSSAFRYNQLPDTPFPEIAFMGRSNVGKSSMINTILNRKNLAQISKKPGKTRSINLFEVNSISNKGRKSPIILADLPGYGFAKVKNEMQDQWRRLLDDYIRKRKSLCGIVIIIDSRHKATRKDIAALRWVREFDKNLMLVATKTDKLSNNKLNKQINKINEQFSFEKNEKIFLFSAKTKFGKNVILNWISEQIKFIGKGS